MLARFHYDPVNIKNIFVKKICGAAKLTGSPRFSSMIKNPRSDEISDDLKKRQYKAVTYFFPGVRWKIEDEHGEEGYSYARDYQVDGVEQGFSTHRQIERDISNVT